MIILRSRVSSCLGDLSESTRGTACQSPAGRDGKLEWMEVCCKRLVYYKMVPTVLVLTGVITAFLVRKYNLKVCP